VRVVKLTPGMKQYMDIKEKHLDAILLFRMGDFYECFFEDAITVSKILNITLTSRGKGETKAPLAGLPYHALDKYLKKLVDSGRKIAICEQIEDPKKAKGIVKRAVTRIITPGTVIEDSILNDKSNNYLASVFEDNGQYGLAICDISTGEFLTFEKDSYEKMFRELMRFDPSEMVTSAGQIHDKLEKFAKQKNIFYSKVHEFYFWLPKATQRLKDHFQIENINSLGLAQKELSTCASGALLTYLADTQKVNLSYIQKITKLETKSYLGLDENAIRNLELIKNMSDNKRSGSLLDVLDYTKTSMGGRLLKKWLVRPLLDEQQIKQRLSSVRTCVMHRDVAEEFAEQLGVISDLERLIARLTYGQANARDLVQIKDSLTILPILHQIGGEITQHSNHIAKLLQFESVDEIVRLIDRTIKDECPLTIREGNFIKRGYHSELDELWEIKTNARQILTDIETREREATGIGSLKIKYNRVFGYFIEVTKRFKDQVPDSYQAKQSTVNAERYVTDELKELETKILSSQERINTIEFDLFSELVEKIKQWTTQIQNNAQKIAELDCLVGFAHVARVQNYVEPQITSTYDLELKDSRHPVIEVQERQFIPNDCALDPQSRMMVITGPNMAGKSTFMRQIALTYIMAQIGCFVPATSATIGVVDTIYTRIGSRDDLSKGQSTFMVEMVEVAAILHNATERSFVILDEIGSGTSTYDGVAIAWSVATDIARRVKCKALFSTHYHVLTKLDQEEGVVNFNVAVHEADGKITFLRKIVEGGTDKSYGVHVAALAGVPTHVLNQAKKIQLQLEGDDKLHTKIVVEDVSGAEGVISESKKTFAKLKQSTLFDE